MSKGPARLVRFVLVGGANTAIDFGLLFLLRYLGVAVLPANIVSTGVALIFSFLLNRSFTFRATGDGRRQLVLFFGVTLFGLWALQPLVIFAVGLLLDSGEGFELLVGKALATVVSMTWNYVLYARLVFRQRPGPVSEG